MSRTDKTNAMRVLEQHDISYVAHTYHREAEGAPAAADAMGISRDRVYKTLVVMPQTLSKSSPLLVMLRGDYELSLKKLAAALGVKRCRMATKREAESLTGLQTGGIGALALLNKPYPCILDADAARHERICVNGGRRGLNLELAVRDLVRITQAQMSDVLGNPVI
jgi:Cys-tRNA(Pro)/Cys-tRNA(Cys) deacylase